MEHSTQTLKVATNMAELQIKFLNLLKTLKIDESQFKDLAFDGLLEKQPALHFLEFLCNYVTSDNALHADESQFFTDNGKDFMEIPEMNELYVDDVLPFLQRINSNYIQNLENTVENCKKFEEKLKKEEYLLAEELETLEKEIKELQCDLTKDQENLNLTINEIFHSNFDQFPVNNNITNLCETLNDTYCHVKEFETKLLKETNEELPNLSEKSFTDFTTTCYSNIKNFRVLAHNYEIDKSKWDFLNWDRNKVFSAIQNELNYREAVTLTKKIETHERFLKLLNIQKESETNAIAVVDILDELLFSLQQIFDEYHQISDNIVQSTERRINCCSKEHSSVTSDINEPLTSDLSSFRKYLELKLDPNLNLRLKMLKEEYDKLFSGPTSSICLLPYNLLAAHHRASQDRKEIEQHAKQILNEIHFCKNGIKQDKKRWHKILWMTFLIKPEECLGKNDSKDLTADITTNLTTDPIMEELNYWLPLNSTKL